jgi:hypothetical protein
MAASLELVPQCAVLEGVFRAACAASAPIEILTEVATWTQATSACCVQDFRTLGWLIRAERGRSL